MEQSNTTGNRNGAIRSDVGADLIIGNESGSGNTWDGDIGWVRVSDCIRYAATFTPPPRCTFPTPDGNTILLEIQEGTGAVAYDYSGNGNDGTNSNGSWDCDCVEGSPAVDPSCEE